MKKMEHEQLLVEDGIGAATPWRPTRKLACYAALALGACATVTSQASATAARQRSVLLQEPINGLGNGHNDYAPYPPKNDPWLAAWSGKGSYKLWAKDYESRHGDGTKYNSLHGTHGLAGASEKPNRLNRKNGWEQAEFFKWVNNQGGDAPAEFQRHGMKKMGSEYIHALKRLSINSFADLKGFNKEYDMPSFMCGEASDVISGHADCGKLEFFTKAAKAQPLWFADNKSHLTSDDIKEKMAGVRAHVKNMLPSLSGERPWDDPVMYCYSQFPEDPEYSQCMSEIKTATDPVTAVGTKPRPWKQMTKGLWKRHADGEPVCICFLWPRARCLLPVPSSCTKPRVPSFIITDSSALQWQVVLAQSLDHRWRRQQLSVALRLELVQS